MRRTLSVLTMVALAAFAAPALAQPGGGGPRGGPPGFGGFGGRGPTANPSEELKGLKADLERLEKRLNDLEAKIKKPGESHEGHHPKPEQSRRPSPSRSPRGFGGPSGPGSFGMQWGRGFGGFPGFGPQSGRGFGSFPTPGGPGARTGGRSGGDDFDKKLDRLIQEIEELRREGRNRR